MVATLVGCFVRPARAGFAMGAAALLLGALGAASAQSDLKGALDQYIQTLDLS
jgi:hypothetical protein